MSWSCVICIEAFANVKGICSSPCGHIFHFSCLNKWISRESQTCPQCRRPVNTSSVWRLYPNISFHPSTSSQATLESDLENAKILIETKDEELSSLKNKQEQLVFYASKAESEVSTLHQKNLELQNKLSHLTLRVKNTKSLEDKVKQLEISNRHQSAELELYQQVKAVVSGRKEEVEGILKNESDSYDNVQLTMKKFATMISVLKRELDLVQSAKSKQYVQILSLKSKLKQATEKKTENAESLDKVKLKPVVSNFVKEDNKVYEDSPILVKFQKMDKKIDVVVLENDTSSVSNPNTFNDNIIKQSVIASSSENKKMFTNVMASKVNEEESITRIGYDGLGGHKSVVGKSDVKLIRRILVDKRVRKPLKSVTKSSSSFK